MRMTKELYKACEIIFKDLDCTKLVNAGECPDVECRDCEKWTTPEEKKEAYDFFKKMAVEYGWDIPNNTSKGVEVSEET